MSISPLPPLPRAVSSFGCVRHGDRVYVSGGHVGQEHAYPPSAFTDETFFFDINCGEWNRAAPRLAPAQGFQLVGHKNYLYAFGGLVHDQYSTSERYPVRSLDIIERYSVKSDKWETVARLPRPRSSYVLGHIADKVYLIGGWDGTTSKFHKEIDIFDLTNETTTESDEELKSPLRRALAAVTVAEEIILVAGLGENSHFDLLADVTSFRPGASKNDRWKELPKIPSPTFAAGAGVVDGHLLAIGGFPNKNMNIGGYTDEIYMMDLNLRDKWVTSTDRLSSGRSFVRTAAIHPDTLAVIGGHSNPTNAERASGHLGWPSNTVEALTL